MDENETKIPIQPPPPVIVFFQARSKEIVGQRLTVVDSAVRVGQRQITALVFALCFVILVKSIIKALPDVVFTDLGAAVDF